MARKKKDPDKLAQDAAAALAAGMSYGRWKAMQDPVYVEKQEPESPQGWLTCKYCGKPFKPKSKLRQYYCEAGCQRAAQVERDREKRKEYYKAYMEKKRAEAGK